MDRSRIGAVAIDGTSSTCMLVNQNTLEVLTAPQLYNASQPADAVKAAKVSCNDCCTEDVCRMTVKDYPAMRFGSVYCRGNLNLVGFGAKCCLQKDCKAAQGPARLIQGICCINMHAACLREVSLADTGALQLRSRNGQASWRVLTRRMRAEGSLRLHRQPGSLTAACCTFSCLPDITLKTLI